MIGVAGFEPTTPSPIINELEASLVTCFTGVSRESSRIIEQQTANLVSRNSRATDAMLAMKASAQDMKLALTNGDIAGMARILASSWTSKKEHL